MSLVFDAMPLYGSSGPGWAAQLAERFAATCAQSTSRARHQLVGGPAPRVRGHSRLPAPTPLKASRQAGRGPYDPADGPLHIKSTN